MMVAVDTVRMQAVSGREVRARSDRNSGLGPDGNQRTASGTPRFRCLFCDAPLRYSGPPSEDAFDWFESDCECVSDGNVSAEHQLGQQLVAQVLFNAVPTGREDTNIDLERRIGTSDSFVIADVRLTAPVTLAVEVVYMTSQLGLRRRLRTLFAAGYPAMIVVLTTANISASRIERHLGKVGTISVGRIDPEALSVELGSVIHIDQVDLETPVWHTIPAYLS